MIRGTFSARAYSWLAVLAGAAWPVLAQTPAGGFTIEDPAQCGPVLDRALATPGPVVVQAVVDPFEPPLPPKINLEQARKFATSLVRGEPNREKIALTVLGDRVRELI